MLNNYLHIPHYLCLFCACLFSIRFFWILLCMQVFDRGARGPKHPVDSAASTLIIRTSQVELVSKGQAPIKGLDLSLLFYVISIKADRPILAFRSILIPGSERWTPPAFLPGLWKAHRSWIQNRFALFAIRVSPSLGEGGPFRRSEDAFQKEECQSS